MGLGIHLSVGHLPRIFRTLGLIHIAAREKKKAEKNNTVLVSDIFQMMPNKYVFKLFTFSLTKE